MLPYPKQSVNYISKNNDGKLSDFTRENDFQSLLPNISDIDVNDPMNDHLLNLIAKRSVITDRDLFQLQGSDYADFFGSDGYIFANFVKFKESSRMKLLKLRHFKPYLFSDPIPLSENIIRSSELYRNILFTELHSQLDDNYEAEVNRKALGKESVNNVKVTNFLQRIRNSQTAQSRLMKHRKLTTASVVIENDYFPPAEESDLSIYIERKHSLRPRPQKRAPVSIQIDRCDLLVQVIGARNVPLRAEFDNLSNAVGSTTAKLNKTMSSPRKLNISSTRKLRLGGRADPDAEIVNQSSDVDSLMDRVNDNLYTVDERLMDERKLKEKKRARSFVEVRFQENFVATSCIDGGAPLWKQSITLPFRPPQDDYTPNNLNQIRDDLIFTLFDEVYEDDSRRGGYTKYIIFNNIILF